MRPRATTFPTSSFSPHSSSRSSEERFCELIRATPSNDAIPWPPRSGITSRHHVHRTREKCANDALGQRDDKLCAIPNQVRRNREIGWHTRLASHHARALLRILGGGPPACPCVMVHVHNENGRAVYGHGRVLEIPDSTPQMNVLVTRAWLRSIAHDVRR